MSTVGSFDRTKHLSELNDPLPNGSGGFTAPTTRKVAALANLGITASAANINASANAAGAIVSVADAATYTVLAADTGKVHVLPNFTANCTITLPTAAAGLQYEFISKAVAVEGQNWIFAAGVPYIGGLTFFDTDDPADTIVTGVFPNGSSNDNMTIVTPSAAGTYIRLVCDGTNWIVNGQVVSATTPTFAD